MVLLAQNEVGFGNLMRLSSLNYLDCGNELPHVPLDALAAHAEGLICLTGGADGPLGRMIRDGHGARARALAERLAALFPDRLYIEIQRHPENGAPRTPAEEASEPGLVGLAYDLDLPLVATNDVHFPDAKMHDAHDALICIADGAYVDQQEPRRRLTPEHGFKSQDEMVALFADLPEAVENTVEIARRCAYRPQKRKPILPKFAEDEVEELRRQAREGLAARLAVIPKSAPDADYAARLDYELGVIEGMGFPGYFLIVADFIKWAKAHDIPVGPGRGSGAGSLVAYALTITDLDPLRYGLLFERFLNPDRISMPDFDIDFCMDRREEVIAYVQEKYGRDRVAQIITFGALLSKAAVRDVGRVLQMPYGQVDRLSKLIPVEGVKPVSIEKALADEPRLREEARREPQVARLLEIAGAIEGLLRNASTHAAGVVIGDRPLVELVPLYRDPRSDMPATQYNMKWVEEAGLVKFDFLGLKTLTVIQNALDLLKARGVAVDIGAIPLDDPKSYELYASAATVAVFQVEIHRHAFGAPPAQADLHRGHRRAGRALPPRPDGEHPEVLQRQERPRTPRKHSPLHRPGPRRDPGHHRLPGAGDGDRPQDGGLLARRRRPAAPGDGQEDPGGDGRREAEVPQGRRRERRRQGQGRGGLEPARQVRQLRLQQVARRRLRGGELPDRLAQGQPPGRVHGRGDELRHPPHRQARPLPPGGRPARHRGGPALRQPLRRHLHRVRGPRRLRPRRPEERRRRGDAADRRGPPRRWPVRRPVRLRRPGRPAPRRQACAGDAGARRRARRARFQPPQGLRRASRR